MTTYDSPIDSSSVPKIKTSDHIVGTSIWGMFRSMPTHDAIRLFYSFMASSILMPTKMRMMPRPYFRYVKYLATAANAK